MKDTISNCNDSRYNKFEIVDGKKFQMQDYIEKYRKVGYFIIHYENKRWFSKWNDAYRERLTGLIIEETVDFVSWLIYKRLGDGEEAIRKFMQREQYRCEEGVYIAYAEGKDCVFVLRYYSNENLFINVYC